MSALLRTKVAQGGMRPRDLGHSALRGLCNHGVQGTRPVSVENEPEHPLFASNPLVTGAPGIRSYMGVPLTTPDGYNLGSLCIMGTEAGSFSDADGAVLESFGRLVVAQLELRMMARRDRLMGTLTRRAFEAVAEETVKAA